MPAPKAKRNDQKTGLISDYILKVLQTLLQVNSKVLEFKFHCFNDSEWVEEGQYLKSPVLTTHMEERYRESKS